jgi:hypothetical protein
LDLKTLFCVLALFGLTSSPAFAQAAATSFTNIRLEGLPAIYVQDQAGRETEGTLVSFTESALVLTVNGMTQTFAPSQVRRIQRKGDSLKNGTIIGLAFGVVMGVLAGGISDCPGGRSSCPGSRVVIPLVAAGFYTAVGAGIDAAVQGRTLLWESGAAASGPPVTLRLLPASVSVRSAIRW